ncbi:EAL domain-containing protein [bacterium]|nr:EAL domain-containing protein [bacterium]
MATLNSNIDLAEQTDASKVDKWTRICQVFDYAFQPIVNIHTGSCYGYEALLRNYEKAGFQSIQDVFDTAYYEGVSVLLDFMLREKAIQKFAGIKSCVKQKLFFNIDNRTLLDPGYTQVNYTSLFDKYHLPLYSLCVEISERHDFETFILHDIKGLNTIKDMLKFFREGHYKIAIDDFGSGLSGLEMLYHSEPDYIKIDRFFIGDIEKDARKKLFVSSILNMVHILGVIVIAEGVENEHEFYVCKEIGCDYIQGYFIQRPQLDEAELRDKYDLIADLNQKDRRSKLTDQDIIARRLEYIEPISLYNSQDTITDIDFIFDSFRRNKSNSFFPLVGSTGEPIGVIREIDLKEFVYSPYGRFLLKRKSSNSLLDFVSRMPVSEINTRVEKILEIFSQDVQSEGILITSGGRYVGFLSASSLVKLLNEKNIAEARDQNPLSKLPGNAIINQYISEAMVNSGESFVFVYYDFDNFKPFNDIYGFRQGDRAIQIFSDILKDSANQKKCFLGHVGGDDFFCSYRENEIEAQAAVSSVQEIIQRFSEDVKSLYKPQDRENGFIIAVSREGKKKKFPLLSVSAGVLVLPAGRHCFQLEDMFALLADLKKQAKSSEAKIVQKVL